MNKKVWIDKKDGLQKLKKQAQANKTMAENDIEDLDFLISCYEQKIQTFK